MNDYIFPKAALAALVTIAGTTTTINAAITQIDHIGNFNFRVEVGGAVAGRFGGTFEGGRLSLDTEPVDIFGTGELEAAPLYTGAETLRFRPTAQGSAGDLPTVIGLVMTGFNYRACRTCAADDDVSFSYDFSDIDGMLLSDGAVYSTSDRVRMTGSYKQGNGRDESITLLTAQDVVFTNGGDTTWIIEAGSSLRLIGLPAPSTLTPVMVGFVACARRRRT